jgi:hypothetical protein
LFIRLNKIPINFLFSKRKNYPFNFFVNNDELIVMIDPIIIFSIKIIKSPRRYISLGKVIPNMGLLQQYLKYIEEININIVEIKPSSAPFKIDFFMPCL